MKFVFDLDGTICFQGRPVSEKILTSLEWLVAQGHEVIFASARPIRDLLPVLHERFHAYPMIGCNGGMAARHGKIISTAGFDPDVLSAIFRIMERRRIPYLIDGPWDYSYTGPSDHPILRNLDPQKRAKNVPLGELQSVVKVLLFTQKNDLDTVIDALNPLDVTMHVYHGEGVLDISPKGIDKWTGLQQLHVKEGEYVAFGNDTNDIAMFRYARYAVMVGDHASLRPYASEQLPLHDHLERNLMEKIDELGRVFW